jgi:hypothetical protein
MPLSVLLSESSDEPKCAEIRASARQTGRVFSHKMLVAAAGLMI